MQESGLSCVHKRADEVKVLAFVSEPTTQFVLMSNERTRIEVRRRSSLSVYGCTMWKAITSA